jgi:hypothetical protein
MLELTPAATVAVRGISRRRPAEAVNTTSSPGKVEALDGVR